MDEKNVRLSIPAEATFARPVRMMAASLAAGCEMSVEDVEDVRMIAEEGFVYACATGAGLVEASFSLAPGRMSMDFSLGAQDPDDNPDDEQIDLVRVLLAAVCDEFSVSDDASTLHLEKRSDPAHGE